MEEASIAAVNGELSPFTTGVTACRMIGACRDLTDYRRASEWIEATERYCDRQSLSGFPGICRIHRAEVAAVGGAWERAEQELERATDRARRLQRDAAAGRRVLRDRRHPPAEGRLRGRRGRAARGARARPIAATGARPHPARRGQGQGSRRLPSTRRVGEETLGSLGAGTAAAGPGRDRHRGRRRRRARTAVDDTRRDRGAATPRRRSRPAARSPWAGSCWRKATRPRAVAELRAAIKGWREVGAPYEVARARASSSRALRAARRRR